MGTVWEQHDILRVLQRVLSSKIPTEMDTMTSRLLTGQLTSQDLPCVTSRMIRVFLCTTAVDTYTERTAFVEQVYPKLREYCRQNYDLEFQMVDLAWGLTADEIGSDLDFPALKLEEIDNCRNTSRGPCFLAFIGQNYGLRPLPSSILAKDYVAVNSAVINDRGRDTRNAEIIDQFYVIDNNSVPPVYLLRPEQVFPELNHENKQLQCIAREQWTEIRSELRYLLQKGALLAFQSSSDAAARFFMSDLEIEVLRGTEQCGNPAERCVLILRDIVDLKNYVDEPKATAFIQISLVPPEDTEEPEKSGGYKYDSEETSLNLFSGEVSSCSTDVDPPSQMLKKGQQEKMSIKCSHSVDSLQLSAEAEICPKCMRRVKKAASSEEKTLQVTSGRFKQEVNEEAEDRLLGLKERVEAMVPEANTLRHEVLWRYEEVIHPELHLTYLQKLCTETYEVLKRLIDDCSKTLETTPHLHSEAQECMHHWIRCCSLTKHLCPCQAPLRQQLRNYVTGVTSQPLVLWGDCGCGKTKMASALAMELSDLVRGRHVCTIRYVGLTAESCRVFPLLRGLCYQICRVLGLDPLTVPSTWQHLRNFFPRFLASLPAEFTVVVVLVGLEKLLLEPDAELRQWLPSSLHQNVKFILTFTTDPPDAQSPEQSVEELFKDYPGSLLEMKPLSLRDAEMLLNHFLSAVHRRISPEQMSVFRGVFRECSLPLHVKLLSLQAQTLYSFSDMATITLPLDTAEAVHAFFDRLETKHSHEVVSSALAYMAANQTGVSDAEMEDLLSLDEAVLKVVYRPNHERCRVPCAVWLKIRRDLEPFLLVQQVDGVTVTVWEHESFEQAVKWRYFNLLEDVISAHTMLADYLLGTWAGKMKALKAVEVTSTCSPPCGVKTDRLVPAQPHIFCCPETGHEADSRHMHPLNMPASNESVCTVQPRLNKRLYNQLPRQLHLSGREKELNELVLFSYTWIFNKIQGFSLSECLDDFLLTPGPETDLVRTALEDSSQVLEGDLHNLGAELSGRLLPYCSTYPWIRTLVHTCDLQGLQHCALLPTFPYHQIPGSPLKNTLDIGFVPHNLTLVHNDLYLLCKQLNSPEVLVWDVRTTELKDSIYTSQGELYVTPNVKYFVIMDRLLEKSFKIHEAGRGQFVGQIVLQNDVVKNVWKSQRPVGPMCLSDNRLYIVTNATDLCVFQVPSGQSLHRVSLPGLSTVCQLSADEHTVLCSAGPALLMFEADRMTQVTSLDLPAKPHILTVLGDKQLAVMAFKPHLLMVLHFNFGNTLHTSNIPTNDSLKDEVIRALRVALDNEHVLVRTDRHVLVYFIPTKNTENADTCCRVRLKADFVKPAEVPAEYRLPRSHYRDLVFTAAEFSPSTECVLAAIFRQVYVWSISDQTLITTVQTPVGVISTLLVSKFSHQLLTHNLGSSSVMVWRLMASSADSTRLQQDRLTRPVQRVLMTSDQKLAFALCSHSDEIGVFEMHTGLLVDLLTHACEVLDMAITPSGEMILVILKARLSGTACLLWYLPKRKVIKEWGDSGSYCVSMHTTDSLILFSQPRTSSLQPPYTITFLHFNHWREHFTQEEYPDACKYVGARPVVSRDDSFVVVSSAEGWNISQGKVVSPFLIVFDRQCGMCSTFFDAGAVCLNSILQVQACSLDASSVAVLVSVKGDVTKGADPKPQKDGLESSQKVGLIMLDLKQSTLSSLIFLDMHPSLSSPPRLLFSPDFSLCLDQASNIYNVHSRTSLAYSLPHPGTPPQCLALHGALVVYFKDSWLYVVRLSDARVTARCQLHELICHVTVCSDQRTLLVGCQDGKLTSYVIVDPVLDSDPSEVVNAIPSRQVPQEGAGKEAKEVTPVRRWDKVTSAPAYSRPPSARCAEENLEQKALRAVLPLPRPRNKESILRPIPCKCLRKNKQGQWVKLKEVKVGFKR